VAPDASAASQILRSYIDDVASRYYDRQATDEEIDASLGHVARELAFTRIRAA
jgi:hypothetical protein